MAGYSGTNIRIEPTLICTKCSQPKDPSSDFYWQYGKPAGRVCKDCRKEIAKIKYSVDPEPYKHRVKKWQNNHSNLVILYKRKWNNQHPNYFSERHRVLVATKRDIINKIKTGPCSDCERNFNPVCMDFDHLPHNPKRANISVLIGGSCTVEYLVTELDKCELVCANCHRLRTLSRFEYRIRTGSNAAKYQKLVDTKRALVLAVKNTPCIDCHNKFHAVCMDFDHIPGRGIKRAIISDLMLGPEKILTLIREINKCEVICANCHRIRTATRREAT